jgi:hypothetical protein
MTEASSCDLDTAAGRLSLLLENMGKQDDVRQVAFDGGAIIADPAYRNLIIEALRQYGRANP